MNEILAATADEIIREAEDRGLKQFSQKQIDKFLSEEAIFKEYTVLLNREGGQSKIELMKYLMRKYNIGNIATMYAVINRVRARKEQEKQQETQEQE